MSRQLQLLFRYLSNLKIPELYISISVDEPSFVLSLISLKVCLFS
jgi:hypothetical protein